MIFFQTTLVINRVHFGGLPRGEYMGLPEVLQSIKNAEESADAKIAASKEEAAKLIYEAR